MLARIWIGIAATAVLLPAPAIAAEASKTWDGLVQVDSRQLNLVYLQPGADFRGYSKVLLEPIEIAFHKDWRRDHNRSSSSSRVSERDVQDAVNKGVTAATDIFATAWATGGYAVVDVPGPDVLRVKTGIVHIRVSAPEQLTAGRGASFANEAGSATLFVEARDSLTGALLGRAIDQKVAGDNYTSWRTRSTNREDFRELVEEWAAASVRGMAELKSQSPVEP
jgi:Protein of unknown function (DUF3313)